MTELADTKSPPSTVCGAMSMVCFLLTVILFILARRNPKEVDVVPLFATAGLSIVGFVLGFVGYKRDEYHIAVPKAGMFLNGICAVPWMFFCIFAVAFGGMSGSQMH